MTSQMLANLKQIATKGGERGPLYDLGVLYVIEQIERTGHFKPSKIAKQLHALPHAVQMQAITHEETQAALTEVAKLNMTIEQASQYCGGILYAEATLGYFAENQQS
jgi:hypothetical protein